MRQRWRSILVYVLAFAATVALVLAALVTVAPHAGAATRPNVVVIVSDDQRWDKLTPSYTPHIWDELIDTPATAAHPAATSVLFRQAFDTNPLCCPSRTTILSGRYSHTTGVWTNKPPYGGFEAFDDRHTVAVDFQQAGYRTGMIGKYLNGYNAGRMSYVPPGWSRWFASNTGAYYDWDVTTARGFRHFGNDRDDYSSRVLTDEAIDFATNGTRPFFLYLSYSAPHGLAIPDARDVGRFNGERDYRFDTPHRQPSSMLDAAYGVDRGVGQLLDALPDDTLVLYLSDNGYMWNDPSPRGELSGKLWPYNESLRVPMVFAALDGSVAPTAGAGDIVANVDVRTSLLHAAGLAPLTMTEGLNWFRSDWTPRDALEIEHLGPPTYCGVRSLAFLYARFREPDGTYTVELYDEHADPEESVNVAGDPAYAADRAELADRARAECDPPPPGYSWPA